MTRHLIALTLALGGLVAHAGEPQEPPRSPAQEADSIQGAETMGVAIYRHERAIAAATEAVLRIPAFRRDPRVKGWITEELGDLIAVTYVDRTPSALYRVTVSIEDNQVHEVTTLDVPSRLSPFEAGAASARQLAMSSGFEPCAEQYNAVVLPAEAIDTPHRWVVYLLPAATSNRVVPMGGTYRVITEGPAVIAQRGFTRTCLALRQDPRAAGLYLTHVMDATPTEAHVFWSLWARQPMYVGTPDGKVWAVHKGRINRTGPDAPKG
ncbi:hypothetical protein [Variovorax sp. JS1663]|uniref:hypothetical protein n=1 Tax=Variovorax sp. JS1663 TaxID=1851577 RepID=UPI000B34671F|nr:hypothetical protein [Variovorax sp. JS1663]OUM04224.1 hypothetical protein A8M77_00465 [Variovorax sp. JS1663]